MEMRNQNRIWFEIRNFLVCLGNLEVDSLGSNQTFDNGLLDSTVLEPGVNKDSVSFLLDSYTSVSNKADEHSDSTVYYLHSIGEPYDFVLD